MLVIFPHSKFEKIAELEYSPIGAEFPLKIA
jgi:hypothetical protein